LSAPRHFGHEGDPVLILHGHQVFADQFRVHAVRDHRTSQVENEEVLAIGVAQRGHGGQRLFSRRVFRQSALTRRLGVMIDQRGGRLDQVLRLALAFGKHLGAQCHQREADNDDQARQTGGHNQHDLVFYL
jgi:hypothetical protein